YARRHRRGDIRMRARARPGKGGAAALDRGGRVRAHQRGGPAMDDVTLYHALPSLCSQKVRLALAEKGVAYRAREVDIGPSMENYEPWYVRLNPRGVVPTLQHGDRVVTDSARILRYIDANFPGPALLPAEIEARAVAEALLDRQDRLRLRELSYAN